MSGGFTLGSKTASELNIELLRSTQRRILPDTRDIVLTIPGRPGAYDFGGEFGPRLIELECVFLGTASSAGLQALARNLATHLIDIYGKPKTLKLVFDDEPDKYYNVRYTGSLSMQQIVKAGRFTLPLVAYDPFAYSVDEVSWASVIASGTSITLTNPGTAAAPVRFRLVGSGEGLYELYPALSLGACPDIALSANSNPRIVINDELQLMYNGVLDVDDELVVDTGTFTATKNGQSVVGDIEGNWILLEPGTSTLQYFDDGGCEVYLEVQFRGRWL